MPALNPPVAPPDMAKIAAARPAASGGRLVPHNPAPTTPRGERRAAKRGRR